MTSPCILRFQPALRDFTYIFQGHFTQWADSLSKIKKKKKIKGWFPTAKAWVVYFQQLTDSSLRPSLKSQRGAEKKMPIKQKSYPIMLKATEHKWKWYWGKGLMSVCLPVDVIKLYGLVLLINVIKILKCWCSWIHFLSFGLVCISLLSSCLSIYGIYGIWIKNTANQEVAST